MIDFPSNPTVGQSFSAAGVTWTWDGTKWTATGLNQAYLPLAGGTMLGPIVLAADPAAPLQAATKQYADAMTRGVTDGSNAAAGQIGEIIQAQASGVAIPINNTVVNVCSINLTAGDWDVSGEANITTGSGTTTVINAGINTVSATMPPVVIGGARAIQYFSLVGVGGFCLPLKTCRISSASPITAYLVAGTNCTAGSPTAIGVIWARRAR